MLIVPKPLPTEEELERIGAATHYRLTARLPRLPFTWAFGLAVTLGTPELLAIVERAANDGEAAAAIRSGSERRVDLVQQDARQALQPGYVPYAIRLRQRRER